MERLRWILGIVVSLALIFVMLITSFEVAAYSDFDWYQKEYEKYNVTKDLTMELDDVMDVTHEMMAYLRGDREDLVVYTTIGGVENQEFFNNQDKIHMAEKFHEVFFTNDLWIFDPRSDYMIRMLPEGFFADMAFRIGIMFVISLLIVLIVSIIYDKICRKKKITISEVRC